MRALSIGPCCASVGRQHHGCCFVHGTGENATQGTNTIQKWRMSGVGVERLRVVGWKPRRPVEYTCDLYLLFSSVDSLFRRSVYEKSDSKVFEDNGLKTWPLND